MSAYVVDDETISVIVDALWLYQVNFRFNDECLDPFINRTKIGQILLNQNIDSVNCRYKDDPTEYHPFIYKHIKTLNEGLILGCIKCYLYQADNTPGFEDGYIYNNLLQLKDKMLEKMIKRKGQEIPWGYIVD